jgi:methionine aminopeptidase
MTTNNMPLITESPVEVHNQPTPAHDVWDAINQAMRAAIEVCDPNARANAIHAALNAALFQLTQEKALDASVAAEIVDGVEEDEAINRACEPGRFDAISDAACDAVDSDEAQHELNAQVHTVMAVLNHLSGKAIGASAPRA